MKHINYIIAVVLTVFSVNLFAQTTPTAQDEYIIEYLNTYLDPSLTEEQRAQDPLWQAYFTYIEEQRMPSERCEQHLFSVSPERRVRFSPGNLQYNAARNRWRFALNQYDFVGEGNENIAADYDGWIDLFGWGTSGWNSGANTYQPWSTSRTASDYYVGGSYENELIGDFAKADWGVYNHILNFQAGSWRTLTHAEWAYLVGTDDGNGRENAKQLRAIINVGGLRGLLLLPDDWQWDENLPIEDISFEKWQEYEAAGAVFMPAAGRRSGKTFTLSSLGRNIGQYWLATRGPRKEDAYAIELVNNPTYDQSGRRYGFSVRLVQDENVISGYDPMEPEEPEPVMVNFYVEGELLCSTEMKQDDILENLDAYNPCSDEEITKRFFEFAGWALTTDEESGEIRYDAVFEPTLLTIGFYSDDVLVCEKEMMSDQLPEYYDASLYCSEEELAKEEYDFVGWELTERDGQPRYFALYKPLVFTLDNQGTQVRFSQGNLRYNIGIRQWSFAELQYDTIGYDNIHLGEPDYDGFIDLFGWSTESTYFGLDPINANDHYLGDFVDWGSNMSDYEGGHWRTPSNDEWKYLLESRKLDGKPLWSKIEIGDRMGLVFLPDRFVLPDGIEFEYGYNPEYEELVDEHFVKNRYTYEQWARLERAGAVFLPAAGTRVGGHENMMNGDKEATFVNDVTGFYSWVDNVNAYGYYWSSTLRDENRAWDLIFTYSRHDDGSTTSTYPARFTAFRRYGYSVRLVQPYPLPQEPEEPETVNAYFYIDNVLRCSLEYNINELPAEGLPQTIEAINPCDDGEIVKEDYEFKGWSLREDEDEIIYDALFEQNEPEAPLYTVTYKFVDQAGNSLSEDETEQLAAGATPKYTANSGKEFENCLFVGWDKVISAVAGDVTYTAKYLRTYQIRFYADWRIVKAHIWNGEVSTSLFENTEWPGKQLEQNDDGWYTVNIPYGYFVIFNNGYGIQTVNVEIKDEACYQLGNLARDEAQGRMKYEVIRNCDEIDRQKHTAVVTFRSAKVWTEAIANVYEPGNEDNVVFDCWPKGQNLTPMSDIEVPLGYIIRFNNGGYVLEEGDGCQPIAENGYSHRTDDIVAEEDICFELGGEKDESASQFAEQGERYHYIHACNDLYVIKVYLDNDNAGTAPLSESGQLSPLEYDALVEQFKNDLNLPLNPLNDNQQIVKPSDEESVYVFSGWEINELDRTADNIIEVHYIAVFEAHEKAVVKINNRTDWNTLNAYVFSGDEEQTIIYSYPWPGTEMSNAEEWFVIDMPVGYTLIVNNGQGQQTASVDILESEQCYNLRNSDADDYELSKTRCIPTTFTILTDLLTDGAVESQGAYEYAMTEVETDVYSITLENVPVENDFFFAAVERDLENNIVASYPDIETFGQPVIYYYLDNQATGPGKFNITFTYIVGDRLPSIEVERIPETVNVKLYTQWDKVYLYAWESETGTLEEPFGQFPGKQLEADNNGWYGDDIEVGSNIVFNNGDGLQTVDIKDVAADICYELGPQNENNSYNVVENKECKISDLGENTLSGEFSVSATQKNHFSKGNLQFNAALGTHQCADGTTQPGTWRFAENQWDMIGMGYGQTNAENYCKIGGTVTDGDNRQISDSYNGWIDLFGWGTSGYNDKYPYLSSIENSVYGDGDNAINNTNYDWGVYNQIGNDAPGTWRTLTADEWVYLFETRTDASDKYGVAKINGITGLVILPDGWTLPYGCGFTSGVTNADDWSDWSLVPESNIYSVSQWQDMESAGAVFLPAVGTRNGTSMHDVGSDGEYWSSSQKGTNGAFYVHFDSYRFYPRNSYTRYYGFGVRLAR